MFIQEAMPPVRLACDSSGIIVHCCLKDGEAVGICGTRRAEEVPGRPAMAFARAGCCRLSRCGERWTWWGVTYRHLVLPPCRT